MRAIFGACLTEATFEPGSPALVEEIDHEYERIVSEKFPIANLTPADAKRILYGVLAQPTIGVVKSFVARDLANLRWAFDDDALFARAIEATAREALKALKSPKTHGRALGLQEFAPLALAHWRRPRPHC